MILTMRSSRSPQLGWASYFRTRAIQLSLRRLSTRYGIDVSILSCEKQRTVRYAKCGLPEVLTRISPTQELRFEDRKSGITNLRRLVHGRSFRASCGCGDKRSYRGSIGSSLSASTVLSKG